MLRKAILILFVALFTLNFCCGSHQENCNKCSGRSSEFERFALLFLLTKTGCSTLVSNEVSVINIVDSSITNSNEGQLAGIRLDSAYPPSNEFSNGAGQINLDKDCTLNDSSLTIQMKGYENFVLSQPIGKASNITASLNRNASQFSFLKLRMTGWTDVANYRTSFTSSDSFELEVRNFNQSGLLFLPFLKSNTASSRIQIYHINDGEIISVLWNPVTKVVTKLSGSGNLTETSADNWEIQK